MSEARGPGSVTMSAARFRWVDRASKLLGVLLIATGLHIGGGTITGIAIAVLGAAVGLLTVIFKTE